MNEDRPPLSGTAAPPVVFEAPAEQVAPPPRERALNAPWPVLAAAGLLVLAFLGQLAGGSGAVIARYGLVPIALSSGRIEGLFTHIVLHGGWLHLFLNTTALMAFGAPVARLYGSTASGALRFFTFFVVCGLGGGLTFWALHPLGGAPLVGASGAISGLMGGTARLIERRGAVGSPFSRPALGFVMPWIVLNLVIAVAGVAFGLPIAWEAHLGGLFAGFLLVGLLAPRRAG